MNVSWRGILRIAWRPWLILQSVSFMMVFGGAGVIWSAFDVPFNGSVETTTFRAEMLLLPFGSILFGAFGLGLALAQAFHEPFDGSLGILLPSARRLLGTAHLALTVGIGAIVALAMHLLQPDSGIPLFGLTVGVVSLWVPLEPGMRWHGSRIAFFTLVGLALVASFESWQLRAFSIDHEFLITAAGLLVAAACFALGYSPGRLRKRATMAPTKLHLRFGDSPPWSHRWKVSSSPPSNSGVPVWDVPLKPCDGSTWSRARLIFRETYGKGLYRKGLYGKGLMMRRCPIFLTPLFLFLIYLGLGYFLGRYLPATVHYRSYTYVQPLAARRHTELQSLLQLLIVGVAIISSSPWPKMDAIYPFSRSERFHIVALWSLAQEALFVTNLLAGIGGEKLGEVLAGNPFDARMVSAVCLLLALIIIPIAQWGAVCRSRCHRHVAQAFNVVAGGIIVLMLSGALDLLLRAFFSTSGLSIGIAVVIGLHAAYLAGLRRVCLKADLVFRSP
jgi:hypothetical protein